MDREEWRELQAERPERSPNGKEKRGDKGKRGPPNSTLPAWASTFRGGRGPEPLGGRKSWGSPHSGAAPPAFPHPPPSTPELISSCHLHGEVLVKEI